MKRTPIPDDLRYLAGIFRPLPPDLDKLFRASPELADACKEAEEFLTFLEPPARTARWAEWSRRRQGVLKQLHAALAGLED